jgi:hypothetical protein
VIVQRLGSARSTLNCKESGIASPPLFVLKNPTAAI